VGDYNLPNILCALTIGKFFGVPTVKMVKAIEDYAPSNSRSQLIEQGTNQIILDAYNANPSSMKAALEGFKDSLAQKKLGPEDSYVVLGDMNEVGENGPSYHEDLGQFIKKLGFSHVCFVGRFLPIL
jgi:UDP-N-acetylmuramoyl-tripeptide--D-alanyl-D-alanine ligase